MSADDRADALIALIGAERDARAREAREPLGREARELLANARRSARARVATAIAEERAAFDSRIAAAEARLATVRRMARQRRMKALLAEGWKRLPGVLAARWADEASRARWIDAASKHAEKVLPAGERQASFDPSGGVRIVTGRVTVDATVAGLLADRLAVEGRLLCRLEEEGT